MLIDRKDPHTRRLRGRCDRATAHRILRRREARAWLIEWDLV
jgi:GH24 family phage-related lysozyme (muramidase)